jgi:hypothetical protein
MRLLVSLLRRLTGAPLYWVIKSGNGNVIAAIPRSRNSDTSAPQQRAMLQFVLPTMIFHDRNDPVPDDESFESNLTCYLSYDRRGEEPHGKVYSWAACSKEGADEPAALSFGGEEG